MTQRHKNRQELVERENLKLPMTSHLPSVELQSNKNEEVKSDVLLAKKEKLELSSLVKSIKMKSRPVPLPSDNKMSKRSAKLQSAGMVEMEQQHDPSNLVRSVKKKSKKLKE